MVDEMINLDDGEVYRRYDPEGMLGHIHNFLMDLCRYSVSARDWG